ncbi:MAG TPA: hypothetical protein VFJ09_10375 [Nocardioidaceae bacterium]|nr:hypothetical protein [Nocardioidaceae bacterium]
MRSQWVPWSASSLVTGVMALVLGSVLGPQSGADAADTLRVVANHGDRWMAMAVLFFISSVALTLGLPTVVTLFDRPRGRWLGLAGTAVFLVGTIGTCGYSMLMTFFHALVRHHALDGRQLDAAVTGGWLSVLLYSWLVGFMLGLLLIAFGLLRARVTPLWVPLLMFAFVALVPVSGHFGKAVQVVQLMTLAVAFTGIAVAATSPRQGREHAERAAGSARGRMRAGAR